MPISPHKRWYMVWLVAEGTQVPFRLAQISPDQTITGYLSNVSAFDIEQALRRMGLEHLAAEEWRYCPVDHQGWPTAPPAFVKL